MQKYEVNFCIVGFTILVLLMSDTSLDTKTRWRIFASEFKHAAKLAKKRKKYVDTCLSYAKPLYLSGLPVIFDFRHFSYLVGYSPEYFYSAISGQETYYRKFNIPKKNGGTREIFEPLPSLKSIQKWILDNILDAVEVSENAKGFVKGRGIKSNARFHLGQEKVVSIDIKDFFPSIKIGKIYKIYKDLGYSSQVSNLLAEISILNGSLPQGSPTSPALSNISMIGFDKVVREYCYEKGWRYTRYADDITVSGNVDEKKIIGFLYQLLSTFGFKPNVKKTRVLRRHTKQLVTGIVVNEYMQAPRELRRRLRQDLYYIKKRGILAHADARGNIEPRYLDRLLGEANFVLQVNPKDKAADELKTMLLKIKHSSLEESLQDID